MLSLFKWYGAFLLSLMFYPIAYKYVSGVVSSPEVASGATIVGLYIASLIAFSIVSGIVIAAMGDAVGNLFDKALGLILGAAIGYVIVSSSHFVISSIYQGNDPKFLKNGKTYEITKIGADLMKKYFKDGSDDIAKDLGIKLNKEVEKIQDKAASQAENLNDNLGVTDNPVDVEQIKEIARKLKEQGYTEKEVLQMIQDGTYDGTKPKDTKDTVLDTIKKSANQLKRRQ